MPNVSCASCGDEFTTRYRKQRYCQICQVLRDLSYGLGRRDCATCGAEFWPIRNTFKNCPRCSEAARITPAAKRSVSECNLCHTQFRIAPGLRKTCLSCVSASRDARDAYRAALVREVRRRKEHSDIETPVGGLS